MKPPNFFVIGMPRAGTTTLWRLLRVHPDVFMPAIKEPRHFDVDLPADPYTKFRRSPLPQSVLTVHRERTQYLALFADADGHQAVGEASLYIRSKIAARRIHDFNPTSKFILMLRDPVDALYSLYHLHLKKGSIRCTFDAFFTEFSPWYLDIPDHLNQIRELFGPESISIHLFEDLERDPHRLLAGILGFLGVAPDFEPEFARYNSSRASPPPGFAQSLSSVLYSPFATNVRMRFSDRELGVTAAISRLLSRPRQCLSAQQKQRYVAVMKTAIQDLAEITGRDLSGWL